MNDKKILMVAATPFFYDRGFHIRVYSEMKYLMKSGYDVTLCTYGFGNTPEGFNVKRCLNFPWYKKITPGPSWHKVYVDVALFFTVLKQVILTKPAIIHAHLYESLIISVFIKILSFNKAKVVFDCQGGLVEELYRYSFSKYSFTKIFIPVFSLLERMLLKFPDLILCSSENSKRILTKNYKISPERISLLSDEVDLDIFKNTSAKTNISVPQGNAVIIYAGSLEKAKGIDVLLDAIPEILQSRKDMTFIFAGYGSLVSEYENELKSFVESGNVIFMGHVSYFDIPAILKGAHYGIETKQNTTESSAKLDLYMAAGLKVLCFKNDFYYSKLGNDGVYLNSVMDLKDLQKIGKTAYSLKTWEENIGILISKYKELAI